VGVSILHQLGLEELVADTQAEYQRKAIDLANDLPRLKDIRKNLRKRFLNSASFDRRQFTRDLEDLFVKMAASYPNHYRQNDKDTSPKGEITKEATSTVSITGPEAAATLNAQGEALFSKGDFEASYKAFLEATQADNNCAVAYNNMGVLHWQTGDLAQAITCFNKAISVDPTCINAVDNLQEIINLELKTKEIESKPTIRIIHNLARSGGTILAKCLGCMQDVVLLSEIHPLGTEWFNPIEQAINWFQLFSPNDIESINKKGGLSFTDAIVKIYQKCEEHNKILVIRDWSHLDFIATPFLKERTNRFTICDILADYFNIKEVALTRHPIDQWLSLSKLQIMQDKLTLNDFLQGYREYTRCISKMTFARYEDFAVTPETTLYDLCQCLGISFDPDFINKWQSYNHITGDTNSVRGSKTQIKLKPRPPVGPKLLQDFTSNQDYRSVLSVLGYDTNKQV